MKNNNSFIQTNNNNLLNKEEEEIKENIIPVVYFDEMGLAEESPYNPLKVIHSELEYDDREKKFGFVGISNWKLDASKMNRTIFLAVPNLEEKDLEETANEIAQNIDREIPIIYKELIDNLVKTYWNYKNFLKEKSLREFHGLRDFYHLIKNTIHYLIEEKKTNNNPNENIMEKSYKIGIKSLYRNFDGLKEPFNSFEKIKEIFDEFYPEHIDLKPNIFDCLEDNIKDNNSRFLLLVMESSISIHLLKNIMNKMGKAYVFYNGSQLNEDMNKEKYLEKILFKIQLNLENGDILVLRNMEKIYPSLYNLFNQNFTILGRKKFARIAFGNYTTYSEVHNDFRAIILVDEKKIKERLEDPPFLNRFEKHGFSFDYLMSKEELDISQKIIEYLDKLFAVENSKICKINLKKQALWYNHEEIKGLILKICKEKQNIINNENDIFKSILEIISKLFSQDIMSFLNMYEKDYKNMSISTDDIKTCYKNSHLYNFTELFKPEKNIFVEGKNVKLIIYTFSKILESCIQNDIPFIYSNGMISKENIVEIIMNSINYLYELNNILEDYYKKDNEKILIFKFTENDLNKINEIKIIINDIEKNTFQNGNNQTEKHIILLICLTRHKIKNNHINTINDLISNIDEEYTQYFIDNLNGTQDTDIMKVLSKNPSDFSKEIFGGKKDYLFKIFQKIFSYLTYEIKNLDINEQNYIHDLIDELIKNNYILNFIKNRVEKELGKDINLYVRNIFSGGNFEKNDIEFNDIIFSSIYDKVYILIFKFIFKAEKDHFLYPLLFNFELIKKEKLIFQYIEEYINNFDFSLVNIIERINNNLITLIMNLYLPLSKKWYDLLNNFIENNIKEDYINNEDNIRFYESKDIQEEIKTYEYQKQDYLNYTKREMSKIEGLCEIIKINNDKYIKYFYYDFLRIYLNKKYNEESNIILGIQVLDILIQLKLNIKKDENYSYNNNNKLSIENTFDDLIYNQKNRIYEEKISIIKYDVDILTNILIFLVCYREEIYSILDIFFTLNKYLKNFFNDWKNIIINQEINEYTPEYTREVNEAFFIIYESLIKCIFNYKQKYISLDQNIFYEYLDSIKKLFSISKQIYLRLFLPSKEMYTLEILINIFSNYDLCEKKIKIKNIQKIFDDIIGNITSENNYIKNKNYDLIDSNYNNLLKLLDQLFDKKNNEKEYYLLLNNLFLSRYNKSLDLEYRKRLVKAFFNNISDNNQFKYILPILKKLINNDKSNYPNKLENNEENLAPFMNIYSIENDSFDADIYEIIININNDKLNLNILFYFECECELYFQKISSGKEFTSKDNKSLNNYMNEILRYDHFQMVLDYYLGEREFAPKIKQIGIIYSIAYIKAYLRKVSEFINYNNNKNVLFLKDIIRAILKKNNNDLIYSLKIFLLKCLFKLENKNYLEFLEYIKNNLDLVELLNHDNFEDILDKNENKHSYNYAFIDINNFDEYRNIYHIFLDNIQQNNQILNIMDKNENNKNFELIYNILINNYIYDLYGKSDNPDNNNLTKWADTFFKSIDKNYLNLHNNSKKLINYLINSDLFYSKILPKLKLPNNGKLNEDILFILIFSIKLVISIQNVKNNIYSIFYSEQKNIISEISNNFFPGSFPPKNEFIESYNIIENHLRNQPTNCGIYICSCGKSYVVEPCGFPVALSVCQNCHMPIGGTDHKLHRREGHFRVFLNEQMKNDVLKFGFDRDMPSIILDELNRKVNDFINTPNKGIGKMSKDIINKTGYNIRKIDELTFRVLNFILCSHLLISNILDIITDKDLLNYFSEETSVFDIMINNWNKMQELLNKRNINNIKIFMNIILSKYDIYKLYDAKERNMIEINFNNIFKDIKYDTISEEYKKYEQQNQLILNSSPEHISSLIQQLYPLNYYTNKKLYPYFEYLYLYSFPKTSEILKKIEENDRFKDRYPLTFKVLKNIKDNSKNIEILNYLPIVNKKINNLINNYSYKISREDASKKTIKGEYNKKDNNLFVINNLEKDEKKINVDEYIKEIVNLFNYFKKRPLQWGCHQLKEMVIDSNSSLSTLLIDDNEPGYYLASIYKKLIDYQNVFLDDIINCNTQNGLLHCFVKQLNNEIMIQNASINEIIKLFPEDNEKNNLREYKDIDELIFVNTSNDPYINKFNYEFDLIEVELGNLILPGVRKFKSSNDELKYVTYMFEGYRGKNSDILTNFNEKYTPINLSPNEKNKLSNFILNLDQDDYKNILFSIQILINFILKKGMSPNTSIKEIIINIPEHLNIDQEVIKLFNSNKEFSINKLVKIFEFFEQLCWEQIQENLLDEFLKPLDKEKIELIDKYFKEQKDKCIIINKKALSGAIRKFISRYLAGKRSQSEIGEDKMLFDYINRADLWDMNIENENFEKEYFDLSNLKIKVGEGKDFYDKLGGDAETAECNLDNTKGNEFKDKNEIILDKKNEEMGKNDEEEGMNNHNPIINIKKKKKKRKLF